MLSEAGVIRLVARICAEIDPETPPPSVVFANGKRKKDWRAHYNPNTKQVVLPRQAWIKRFKVTTSLGYRLLVLHEVAHHLFESNHSKEFYVGLFGLCDLYGVPLSYAYADELDYKPRSSAKGLDSYVDSLRLRIDELSAKS